MEDMNHNRQKPGEHRDGNREGNKDRYRDDRNQNEGGNSPDLDRDGMIGSTGGFYGGTSYLGSNYTDEWMENQRRIQGYQNGNFGGASSQNDPYNQRDQQVGQGGKDPYQSGNRQQYREENRNWQNDAYKQQQNRQQYGNGQRPNNQQGGDEGRFDYGNYYGGPYHDNGGGGQNDHNRNSYNQNDPNRPYGNGGEVGGSWSNSAYGNQYSGNQNQGGGNWDNRNQYGNNREQSGDNWNRQQDHDHRGGRNNGGNDWWGRTREKLSSWFGDDRDHGQRQQYATPGDEGTHRGKGPRDYRRSDDRIREDVCDRLYEDPHLDASGIEVRTENGEVTLNGTVENRNAKRRAEDLADSIPGVAHVQNNLRVGPLTTVGSSTIKNNTEDGTAAGNNQAGA